MKPKDIEDINFATATITFLYTDTTTEEGYFRRTGRTANFFLGKA